MDLSTNKDKHEEWLLRKIQVKVSLMMVVFT